MATVNFSIPDDIKSEFDHIFQGKNKSAVIANLMREAVERSKRKRRSDDAVSRILKRRQFSPIRSGEDLSSAKNEGRK